MVKNLSKLTRRRSTLLGGQIRIAPQVDRIEARCPPQFVRSSRHERLHRLARVVTSKRDDGTNHGQVLEAHNRILRETIVDIGSKPHGLPGIACQSERNSRESL